MIRTTIERIFASTYEEQLGQQPPEISDTMVLLESGLDSLGFAVLVTRLEEELGFDPFSMSSEPYYPRTFGEFVAFYERNVP